MDCTIYLLDYTAQITADDCVNCKIVVGPVDGSAFFRDCKGCTISVACRQLRTRDCHDMEFRVFCATQPSIETSTGLRFGCWQAAWPGLSAQFKAAKLDPTRNTFAKVFDFNEGMELNGGAKHWLFLSGAEAAEVPWKARRIRDCCFLV